MQNRSLLTDFDFHGLMILFKTNLHPDLENCLLIFSQKIALESLELILN